MGAMKDADADEEGDALDDADELLAGDVVELGL